MICLTRFTNKYTSLIYYCIILNNILLNMHIGQSQSMVSDRFMIEKRNASFKYKIYVQYLGTYIFYHLLKKSYIFN